MRAPPKPTPCWPKSWRRFGGGVRRSALLLTVSQFHLKKETGESGVVDALHADNDLTLEMTRRKRSKQ